MRGILNLILLCFFGCRCNLQQINMNSRGQTVRIHAAENISAFRSFLVARIWISLSSGFIFLSLFWVSSGVFLFFFWITRKRQNLNSNVSRIQTTPVAVNSLTKTLIWAEEIFWVLTKMKKKMEHLMKSYQWISDSIFQSYAIKPRIMV